MGALCPHDKAATMASLAAGLKRAEIWPAELKEGSSSWEAGRKFVLWNVVFCYVIFFEKCFVQCHVCEMCFLKYCVFYFVIVVFFKSGVCTSEPLYVWIWLEKYLLNMQPQNSKERAPLQHSNKANTVLWNHSHLSKTGLDLNSYQQWQTDRGYKRQI